VELAHVQRAGQSGRLTMAGISYVFTISRVAEMLGEDEEWLDEISIQLDPEDGRLRVLGLGDEATTAFSPFGVDNLAELVQIHKADPGLLPRRPKPRE
jgi:hypothetical protein